MVGEKGKAFAYLWHCQSKCRAYSKITYKCSVLYAMNKSTSVLKRMPFLTVVSQSQSQIPTFPVSLLVLVEPSHFSSHIFKLNKEAPFESLV